MLPFAMQGSLETKRRGRIRMGFEVEGHSLVVSESICRAVAEIVVSRVGWES